MKINIDGDDDTYTFDLRAFLGTECADCEGEGVLSHPGSIVLANGAAPVSCVIRLACPVCRGTGVVRDREGDDGE